jgi:hypothetical protein
MDAPRENKRRGRGREQVDAAAEDAAGCGVRLGGSVGTVHHDILQSEHQLVTACSVHVINLTPGSDNPTRRRACTARTTAATTMPPARAAAAAVAGCMEEVVVVSREV